jgi:hypothetical protein
MPSFSQRYGHTPAEKAFQRENVSAELRTALWNCLNLRIWDRWQHYEYCWSPDSERINGLMQRLWLHHFKADIDQLPAFHRRDGGTGGYDILKKHFFQCKWYEVFDFIEFMAKDRDPFLTGEMVQVLNGILERENSAYRLVANDIVEITDKHQIAAIREALRVPASPVQVHLNTALDLFSDRTQPDYRNSIKESISAVEAACRELSKLPKATLGDALKGIPGLHPALHKAFSSLYGSPTTQMEFGTLCSTSRT